MVTPEDKRKNEQNKEDYEKYLGDAGSGTGYAAETENSGNDRDDQKYTRPIKHKILLLSFR